MTHQVPIDGHNLKVGFLNKVCLGQYAEAKPIFSRVLRHSTPRYVGRSDGW